MNILMVCSTVIPAGDGISTHVVNLAKGLALKGHRVDVISKGWKGCLKKEEVEPGVMLYRGLFMPLYPFHWKIFEASINKIIKDERLKPDIIHVHSPIAPNVNYNKPFVLTIHTPVLDELPYIRESRGIRGFLLRVLALTISCPMEKRALAKAQRVIVLRQSIERSLRERYGYRGETAIIPNMTEIVDNTPVSSPSQKRVLYVGRISERKGIFDLLKAAARVVKEESETEFLIAGEGPFKKRAILFCKEMGILNNVKFLGEIKDRERLVAIYRDARCLVIPSHYEGMPMVLLEAMALGKAIISSRADFSEGILTHRKDALLFDPGKHKELAEAISRILASLKLTISLGEEARKTLNNMRKAYDNIARTERVYLELTGER